MEPFNLEVLNAIADDYEEVETILADLRSWHPEQQIEEIDVAIALRQLVEQGLANAYELSANSGASTIVSFEPERLNELYFYASVEGKKKLIG